jgi:hypothetical protein
MSRTQYLSDVEDYAGIKLRQNHSALLFFKTKKTAAGVRYLINRAEKVESCKRSIVKQISRQNSREQKMVLTMAVSLQ